MPVIINVKFSQERARGVITGLKRVESGEVIKNLDLSPFQQKALAYLKRVFPKSKNADSSSVEEFGDHLVEGWRTSRIVTTLTKGFEFYHTDNSSRARTVLSSIDTGSGPNRLTAAGLLRFGIKRRSVTDWVSLAAGRTIIRPSRSGTYYTRKTIDYVESILMPKIGDEVLRLTKVAMENNEF